ncbi:hypothetical protein HY498_03765 [Candidatus Woesearchaeota archaeon]|nr:hypothetical protein [Candidatus Woesearchaeota archaeon]
MVYGIIGLILLAIGWVFEVIELIKNKKSRIDVKFGFLYVVGSLFLLYHAISINDLVFMILNGAVALLSLISMVYSFKK